MKKSQTEWSRGERRHGRLRREGSGRTVRAAPEIQPTTAKNLEDKFDRGEDVLDYFDVVRTARVIKPQPAAKAKFCIRQSGIPNGPLPFARNQRVIAKRHSRLRPLSSVFGPPWLGVVPRLRDEGGLLLTVAASELSDAMLEAVNAADRSIRSILIPTF